MNEYPNKDKILYAPKASIMVVDDNSMNRRVFAKLLQDTHIQIEEAESGAVCLEKLNKKHFDLIFMDHMMPMMDGIETFHRIREIESDNSNVKVIALTANTDPSAGNLYINEGFSDFVIKPMKPDMLKAAIIKHLDPYFIEEPEGLDGNNYDEYASSEAETNNSDLPVIDGLDWELAISHFNDREIMWETLQNFYKTLTRDAGHLSILFNSLCVGEEITRYRICVHSMKSISKLVGFAEVSDMARKLEEAAERKDIQYIYEMHDPFIEKWMDCHVKLCNLFEKDEELKEIDKNAFIGHLERLANASEMLDVDVMDPVAKELETYEIPWEGGKEKLNNLLAAVIDLDTDTIATLTEELKAECIAAF